MKHAAVSYIIIIGINLYIFKLLLFSTMETDISEGTNSI
jgi:hypothetical protein